MGYWVYYAAWIFLSYALRTPWAMVGVIVFVVLHPVLPDPVVLLRTWSRIRSLDREVLSNPANVTARRQLAMLWLERMRPRRALELLDEARKRFPDDADLLFLTGLARLRSRNPEGALDPLVRAVDIDPKLRYGEPYLVAAEALAALERWDAAEDALERYVESNGSSIQGWYRLSDVRRRLGNREGAKEALDEARSTWTQVPTYRKRLEVSWWLRAQLARFWT